MFSRCWSAQLRLHRASRRSPRKCLARLPYSCGPFPTTLDVNSTLAVRQLHSRTMPPPTSNLSQVNQKLKPRTRIRSNCTFLPIETHPPSPPYFTSWPQPQKCSCAGAGGSRGRGSSSSCCRWPAPRTRSKLREPSEGITRRFPPRAIQHVFQSRQSRVFPSLQKRRAPVARERQCAAERPWTKGGKKGQVKSIRSRRSRRC